MKKTLDLSLKDGQSGKFEKNLHPKQAMVLQASEIADYVIALFNIRWITHKSYISLENIKASFLHFDNYLEFKNAYEQHFTINLKVRNQVVRTLGIFRMTKELHDVAGGPWGQLGILKEVPARSGPLDIAKILMCNLFYSMAVKYSRGEGKDKEISDNFEKLSKRVLLIGKNISI